MSDATTHLGLPFLQAAQAQKHVTINESLLRLDALVQLAVISASTSAQPGSPADGALYILPAGKTGADWGAMADHALAYYRDGVWEAISPREGWTAHVSDTDARVAFTGAVWSGYAATKTLTLAASDKILGRVSASGGAAEEVAFTDQAQALCDDTSYAAMRTTIGAAGLADSNAFSEAQTIAKNVIGDFTGISVRNTNSDPNAITYLALGNNTGSPRAFMALLSGAAGFWGGASSLNFGTLTNADIGVIRNSTHIASFGASKLNPVTDNSYNLGDASHRFGTIYAGTGTINTSDAREKTALEPLPDAVKRAVRRVLKEVGVFQWRDAISVKGDERARLHIGATAQSVRDAFAAEGVDPERWALFCADPLSETVETVTLATETERRAVYDEVEDSAISIEKGHARRRREIVRKPRMASFPLHDENDAPVRDDNGAPVFVEAQVFEDVSVTRKIRGVETRDVLDERGQPMTRFGLRTDQLVLLALAALAE